MLADPPRTGIWNGKFASEKAKFHSTRSKWRLISSGRHKNGHICMRKYQKSRFILLISDGVWGLFLIHTFLKNRDPPPLFSKFPNWNWDISVFFTPLPPIGTLSQIFSILYFDGSPKANVGYISDMLLLYLKHILGKSQKNLMYIPRISLAEIRHLLGIYTRNILGI